VTPLTVALRTPGWLSAERSAPKRDDDRQDNRASPQPATDPITPPLPGRQIICVGDDLLPQEMPRVVIHGP
jgi:hypothetical protein